MRLPVAAWVLFALVCAGCQVREDPLDPLAEYAPARVNAKTEAPAESDPAARIERTIRTFRPLSARLTSNEGTTEIAGIWLDELVVAPVDERPWTFTNERERSAAMRYAGPLGESGLGVWVAAAPPRDARPPLAETDAELDESLTLLAFLRGRPVRLAVRSAALPTTENVRDATGLLLLGHPFVRDFAGAALLDEGGRLAGVISPLSVHGLLAALPAFELRRLRSVEERQRWRDRARDFVIPAEPASKGNDLPVEAARAAVDSPSVKTETPDPVDLRAEADPGVRVLRPEIPVRLGLRLRDLTPELAEAFGPEPPPAGALVQAVLPEGPAAEAGFLPGDLIVSLAGQPVHSLEDLPPVARTLKAGWRTACVVRRKTETLTLPLTPGPKDR